MLRFSRRLRHFGREAEVAVIIGRYFGRQVLDWLGLRHLVPRGFRSPAGATDFPPKLRAAIEELGPTYIKLGQVLSVRPDVVPPRYLAELARLQDAAPPVPFEKVRGVVEQEQGRPIGEAYRFFSRVPIAAASLGQAHEAILPDGTAVVVKVQRPGVRRVVETDIEILLNWARLLSQRYELARVVNLVELVEEFQITTRAELDYLREARSMERLRENLRQIRKIQVPQVYWQLTTPRVLTQERVRGTKVTDLTRLRDHGIDPRQVAQTLGEAFMKQIFVDGFFHADPHPGNVVVTDEGAVVLLDFGMMARIDESMRQAITRLLVSFTEEDSSTFAQEILDLGRPLQPVDRKQFTADADRVLRQYYDLPARDVNIGAVLYDTLRVATQHAIQTPSNFGLLVKVLAHLDGIAKLLDPDYSYLDTARDFVRRAVVARFDWQDLSLDLARSAGDVKRFLTRLPLRSDKVLARLAEGEFGMRVEHEGVEELTRHLDKIGNRVSYSLVVAALLIGSGLFALARVPPFVRGYPVIAAATFVVALAMGIWLLVAILRSGNLR
ncbi:MAG: AarF/ABC1/UbiB kinase family protein [Armatimonadetes bacterium]|nr:AarF/ABC1/UbiB kinase family protein [Armatimonadota bacterium]